MVFSDCKETIDDLETYSRVLDDNNEPTEKIEDQHSFHLADSLRYVMLALRRSRKEFWIETA